MRCYHYKLKWGYEALFPGLKLSLKVLALDFQQADENIAIAYGAKYVEYYSIFTITKL